MKKRGFTLVELLAVIVILAIVALIAVPIILNVIRDAREKSIVNSILGLNDAVEKAIAKAAMEDKTITEGLTPGTEEGCYKIDEELYNKVKVKGEKPSEGEICIDKKGVNKIIGAKINGESNVSYIGTSGRVKIGNRVIGTIAKAPSELKGIAKQDYNVGATISYLGYNWKVMKDNGTSVQLVMDGYLSSDELKANLPSNVDSSNVDYAGGMSICLGSYKQEKLYNYCYDDYTKNRNREYTWKTSIIKPTIENWLDNKMEEKGLTKEKELVGMSFSDGVETINSYIRIPTYNEVKAFSQSDKDGYTDGVYSYNISRDSWAYADFNYYTLTRRDDSNVYIYIVDGGRYLRTTFTLNVSYPWTHIFIRPVITVNKN